MQLAKALSWMALNGYFETPKLDLDTGSIAQIVYEIPKPTFFILAWLFNPFPNAPGVTYVKTPAYGGANWPPKMAQVFLNKGGIFDLLERVSVTGRAADGSETILTF